MKKITMAAILVLFGGASSAGPPLNFWIDFAFPVDTMACFGEKVIASGRAHLIERQQGDAPERFHVNAQGTAVGTITGNTWLWRDHVNLTCNERCFIDETWKGTESNILTLVGPGHLPDALIKFTAHATVIDGDPKVFFFGEDVKCK